MGQQGTYPIGGRTLASSDTLTGVVTGATADVPLSTLAAFIGTGVAPMGGVAIGSFTLDHTTPNARVEYPNTNPAGWNTDQGRMRVDMQVTPNSYFAANPNGHFAVVLRCTTSLIATAVRGQGIAIGNATGFAQPSDLNPTPLIETWFNGFAAGNFLWSNSESARSTPMQDGRTYRIIIDATKAGDGNRYIRYRMLSLRSGTWYAEVDTGDVLDTANVYADLTQSGFVVGQVFESNLVPWSLSFTNCNITWGPAENPVPDQTIKLSRFGAELEGDLHFVGNSRKVKVTSSGAAANWTAVQSAAANTATTWTILPNGTATSSNVLAANVSSLSGSYQVASFGMSGSTALIETFNSGATDPNLRINIGAGLLSAIFKATGLQVLGATKDIGQPAGYSVNITNWGGSVSNTFSTTQTLNMENFCTIGYMSNYMQVYGGMPAAYAQSVEDTLRPLYCLFSFLVKNLQDKKVA